MNNQPFFGYSFGAIKSRCVNLATSLSDSVLIKIYDERKFYQIL